MRLSTPQLLILSLLLATIAVWVNAWLESQQNQQEIVNKPNLKNATWLFSDTQVWRPLEDSDQETIHFSASEIKFQQNQHESSVQHFMLIDSTDNTLNLISSDNATLDKQQNLQLNQNANFIQYKQSATDGWQQQIQLSGEQFTYNSQQHLLNSQLPVKLVQANTVTLAGSLKANLETGEWIFDNGIQGTVTQK